MTLPTLTTRSAAVVLAAVLAIAFASSRDAAEARKHKKRVAAPAAAAKTHYRGHNLFPAGPVYNGRDYLGDDPDPFIRSQIYRDLGARYGGPD